VNLGVRRRWLWSALVVLVTLLLVMLVWLAGRHEQSQTQSRLEQDLQQAADDIKLALARNAQTLWAVAPGEVEGLARSGGIHKILQDHREIVLIEWRDRNLVQRAQLDSPYRARVFTRLPREEFFSEWSQACQRARRAGGAAYSESYFVPAQDGLGLEVMDLCLPLTQGGDVLGFLLMTYSLEQILDEMVVGQLKRHQEVSFTETDGTRLAVRGGGSRSGQIYTAQALLDLPGNTVLLRSSTWRNAAGLFPNVLTALVVLTSIALLTVVALLGRDTRRRIKAERELEGALAFRKAMEDSLITGLRARDLDGRTTYVNPAFCHMVGFSASELLTSGESAGAPAPYWPRERVDEYAHRRELRLAGQMPPREGHESVFMRRDGSEFPVMIFEAPLVNAQGQQSGWMSAVVDISEQRRVQEQSRASHERLQASARLAAVGEMASLLSHEINQPLAAISSYATGSLNLMEGRERADPALQDEILQALQRIAEQAQRAGKVVRSVGNFANRRDNARVQVEARELLDAVLPLVQLQAKKQQMQVDVQVAANLPPLWCDRTLVEQALLNLARNGIQAMEASPPGLRRLVLRAALVAADTGMQRVEFSVLDHGSGVPADIEDKLFTPFFTTKPEGMGLGLSLCRTVAEQHGGALVYEPNTGPDGLPCGVVFRFSLPLAANFA
jgi:two-component system, LuxR family, sensor histidine kinase DctS